MVRKWHQQVRALWYAFSPRPYTALAYLPICLKAIFPFNYTDCTFICTVTILDTFEVYSNKCAGLPFKFKLPFILCQVSVRTLAMLTLLFNQNIFRKFCLEPRLFKLYEELEAGEHGTGDPMCSYGLDDANDTTFTSWNGTIVGIPNSTFDGRIYFLSMTCGENYPA